MKRSPVRRKRLGGPRRGPWRSVKYRMWIASYPCIICARPDTQAAHTQNNGMRSKGPDSSCVPLCPLHHFSYDKGREAFEKYYNPTSGSAVGMKAIAASFYEVWQENHAR